MVRGIIDAYAECFGINGSETNDENTQLPPEVRDGTTATTTETTTTTDTSTTDSSSQTKTTNTTTTVSSTASR